MAYNDDAVLARLSGINDSHDSIATAAQWIMFHRRHADRTVALWNQRLKDSSPSRRLTLIYLANEVAQQSRIRHKEDFVTAFSPIMAEAVSTAYKGAPQELQSKIRRVLDVWRDRAIFEKPIQEAIDNRLNELDKTRGASKPGFGGSPFGGAPSVPPEFASVVAAHQTVAKLSFPLKSTISSVTQDYEKQTDPATPVPSAPVYAARLNGLLKTLANAESAVAECVKARDDLILGLEKLLEVNRAALEQDKEASSKLAQRKAEIEEKKQQVEVAIMQALGSTDNDGHRTEGESHTPSTEPDRPRMESLTPPPMVEPLSPPEGVTSQDGDAAAAADAVAVAGAVTFAEAEPAVSNTVPSYHSLPVSSNGSNKRRRVDDGGDFPDLGADDGIDADVAEMLKDGTS